MNYRPEGHEGPYILIHTDGSCRGNPGPGGYAAILRKIAADGRPTHKLEVGGGTDHTTNQRMELEAAIRGLQALKRAVLPVVVVTDSQYVRKGITEWVPKWKVNGWMTSACKPVANVDLWEALDRVAAEQRVDWRWTKGHAGDPMNDEADQLASREASRAARKLTT